MVVPCHFPKQFSLSYFKQSLKELGISLVRALLGPCRTTIGFPLIYQVTKCVLSNQREVFKAVVLSSLQSAERSAYRLQRKVPRCQEEQLAARPPWNGTRRWIGELWTGGRMEVVQEENDHHLHCRWHPVGTAVRQSSCCRG